MLAERTAMNESYEANKQKMMNTLTEKEDLLKVCMRSVFAVRAIKKSSLQHNSIPFL